MAKSQIHEHFRYVYYYCSIHVYYRDLVLDYSRDHRGVTSHIMITSITIFKLKDFESKQMSTKCDVFGNSRL